MPRTSTFNLTNVGNPYGGGSEPDQYLKAITKDGLLVTVTDKDTNEVTFTTVNGGDGLAVGKYYKHTSDGPVWDDPIPTNGTNGQILGNNNGTPVWKDDTSLKTTDPSYSGNAATATKLATARTLKVNLASTSGASFDGSADKDVGVKGSLPITNGGTGATSAADARTNLGLGPLATKHMVSSGDLSSVIRASLDKAETALQPSSLDGYVNNTAADTTTSFDGNTHFLVGKSGKNLVYRTAAKLLEWIKSQLGSLATKDSVAWSEVTDKPTDYLTGGSQTATSTADGGTNTFTFTRADGSTATFDVKNGTKGSKGDKGTWEGVVDTAMSSTSTNPVQNKVITEAINTMVNTSSIRVNVPSSSTKYVHMHLDGNMHTYLCFFNGSLSNAHQEWLFRTYGDGGIPRTAVNIIGADDGKSNKWYVAGNTGVDFYIEYMNTASGTQYYHFRVASLDGSKLPDIEVVDNYPSGYVEMNVAGVYKASKLSTTRLLKTDLGSETSAQFDGSADKDIGVKGTLPISHGGTGATTAEGARTNLGLGSLATKNTVGYSDCASGVKSSLDKADSALQSSALDTYINGIAVDSTTSFADATTIVVGKSGKNVLTRTALALWIYIKGKLSGSDVDIGGTAAKVSQSSGYGTLVSRDSNGNLKYANEFTTASISENDTFSISSPSSRRGRIALKSKGSSYSAYIFPADGYNLPCEFVLPNTGGTIATVDGDINGNAATATKATQDADGNTISSTYVKKASSNTFTAAQTFASDTYMNNRLHIVRSTDAVTGLELENSQRKFKFTISDGQLKLYEDAAGKDKSPSSAKTIIYSNGTGDNTEYFFNGRISGVKLDTSGSIPTSTNAGTLYIA